MMYTLEKMYMWAQLVKVNVHLCADLLNIMCMSVQFGLRWWTCVSSFV